MISILPDNVSDDKKAEILNDHYKDTCLKLAGYRKQRNRLVFFAVITLAIIPFIVVFPAETLRFLGAFFRRASIDDLTKKTDNPQYYFFLINFVARLIPGAILMNIAFAYKHYRIAMDKQFTYIKMLESELNSLYPESNLFNRETNFSSKESNSFSMWGSEHYGKVLKGLCYFSAITYITRFIPYPDETNITYILKVLIGIYGTWLSLTAALFFATKKPLTGGNIISLLMKKKEID